MLLFVFLVLTLAAGMPDGSFALGYYVDYGSGSDACSGTSTSIPWKHCPGDASATGTPALVSLLPGDTVTFRGGVAYEGTIFACWSGTAAHRITYRGSSWGSGRAVIHGRDVRASGFVVRGSNLTIEGFEIRHTTGSGIIGDSGGTQNVEILRNRIHDIGPFPADVGSTLTGVGVYLLGTKALLVQENEIYDLTGDAVRVVDSNDVTIRGNRLYNGHLDGFIGGGRTWLLVEGNRIYNFSNLRNHGDALQIMEADTAVVRNNIIYDCTQDIYFDTYSGPFQDIYIYDNIVFNTASGSSGLEGFYNGINVDNSYNSVAALYVYNNTLADLNSGSGGFRSTWASSNAKAIGRLEIKNNIFFNCILNLDFSTITAVEMDNNLYFNQHRRWSLVLPDPLFCDLSSFRAAFPVQEQHGIEAFPNFETGSLWYLRSDSPAVDAGTPLAPLGTIEFRFDALGVPRPQGGAWDLGAYEYSPIRPVLFPPKPRSLRLKE